MERGRWIERLVTEVGGWPGITPAPHRFGGTEFRFGRGEIGHVHTDGLVDVAFPKPVRDALVASGTAVPHHVLPDSGWVSFRIRRAADVAHAVELLRRAYEVRLERAAELALERRLDEALDESFPASDPPAVGRVE